MLQNHLGWSEREAREGTDGVSGATVYFVDFDVGGYRSLLLDISEDEFDQLPALDGQIAAEVWPTPPVIIEPSTFDFPSPDVWHLMSIGKAPVVTAEVADRLEPFISAAGELLPLRNNTPVRGDFYALNVLNQVSMESLDLSYGADERGRLLDEYASLLSADDYRNVMEGVKEGNPWPVLYPAFISGRLVSVSTFFRVTGLQSVIFVLDRDGDDDTLSQRIQAFEITGLTLVKVWSSETGPEDLNLLRR